MNLLLGLGGEHYSCSYLRVLRMKAFFTMRFLLLVPPEGAGGGVVLRRRHRLALRGRGVVVVLGDLGAGAVGGRARPLAPGAHAGGVEDAAHAAHGADAAADAA